MKIYPFFIPHAGCPHFCRFCQQQRLSGRDQAPPPQQVAEDLSRLLPKRGQGEVAFYGGSFTLLKPFLQRQYLQKVSPFIDAGQVAGVRISTRPDAVDEEKLALLREGGVTTVELGCQSFSEPVLAKAGRGHGAQEAALAVKLLRAKSFQVGVQLMPGLPGAGAEEALQSLGKALELKPDFIRIYPTVVLQGTLLAEDFRQGRYTPLSLEEVIELCAEMLWHCRQAAVPVIRLGLQATPALDSGQGLVAGPYHPAFGAMVRARLWRRALASVMNGRQVQEVQVHPADLSDVLGQRRTNLEYFAERGQPLVLRSDETIARDHFALGGRLHDLHAAASFKAIPSIL